jgi:mitotic-spindle organizing protein 1
MCQEMSSSDKKSNNDSDLSQIRNSQELRANLHNISNILNTGLSAETLDICIQLCEAGVHPQALANVIQQIRREVAQIQHDNNQQNSNE